MFRRGIGEPVLTIVAVCVRRVLAFVGEPVGPFPAGGFAETCAALAQLFMQRRPPHAARRVVLIEWPVYVVEQAQRFLDPVVQEPPIGLKRHVAADVDAVEIARWCPIAQPFGYHLADATG